ncbi:TolB family protein [Nocardioides zhouii]|uniref:Lipoprotein LpqB beta-propeller domain-containing protein n=1 Tax=Nocardioides zhouii TaxID=1168729 RepID=A0A4Q2T9F0_9ACTN|nr:PD40 domain-containing protein [Nocardioides zhouii]RYC13724.1 hypothetical protein EUA94_03725 [Nocardioides zhouii]
MTSSPGSATRRTYALTTAAAVLTLAGCSSQGAGGAEAASAEPPEPRVLFQAQGEHTLVALAFLDGSHVTYPLDDLPGGNQTNPDWSPDGSQVVFALDDGSRESLWVADADGGNARELLPCRRACAWLDDPDWSPDGSSVVYSRTVARGRNGLSSLEVVDVDTGEVSVILPPRARTFTSGARWSPDGSQIVFEDVHKVSTGLEAEVDGVSLRVIVLDSRKAGPPLTAPDIFAVTPDWSPDGATIVFSGLERPDAETADLFVIPAIGGEPRQVTHLSGSGGYADEPTWRADSAHLVFSGKLPDSFQGGVLLTVPADGSSAPQLLGGATIIGRHPRVEPGV